MIDEGWCDDGSFFAIAQEAGRTIECEKWFLFVSTSDAHLHPHRSLSSTHLDFWHRWTGSSDNGCVLFAYSCIRCGDTIARMVLAQTSLEVTLESYTWTSLTISRLHACKPFSCAPKNTTWQQRFREKPKYHWSFYTTTSERLAIASQVWIRRHLECMQNGFHLIGTSCRCTHARTYANTCCLRAFPCSLRPCIFDSGKISIPFRKFPTQAVLMMIVSLFVLFARRKWFMQTLNIFHLFVCLLAFFSFVHYSVPAAYSVEALFRFARIISFASGNKLRSLPNDFLDFSSTTRTFSIWYNAKYDLFVFELEQQLLSAQMRNKFAEKNIGIEKWKFASSSIVSGIVRAIFIVF